jgi:thioesterase domain-containing protein
VRVEGNEIDAAVAGLVAELRVVVVGGDHDSMMMHPHVGAIARVINGA